MEDLELINTLRSIGWGDIEKQVALLNPHLHRLISALSPDNSYRIYRVRYPYGTVFVKNGLFQLPDGQGKMQSLMDERVPSQIKEDLSYNKGTNPVSLLLNYRVRGDFRPRLPTEPCVRDRTRLFKVDVPIDSRQTNEVIAA